MICSAIFISLVGFLLCQQVGDQIPEIHPKLTWWNCTTDGCIPQEGGVVLNANFRWLHSVDGTGKNCQPDGKFDAILCPDPLTCAKNCALEGIDDYAGLGVTTQEDTLRLEYKNSPNVFLTDEAPGADGDAYVFFQQNNHEFSFDVDLSTLTCGSNAAFYLTNAFADAGRKLYPSNQAGPKYGTGECDAQCGTGRKFKNGEANMPGFNDGAGLCCAETDIWEANRESTVYTMHPCDREDLAFSYFCGENYEISCNSCAHAGCAFNSYTNGEKDFYGPGRGKTVDTLRKFTVVTQFITEDGTDDGPLKEIRRYYVQDGKIIPNTFVTTRPNLDSLSEEYCPTSPTDEFVKTGGWSVFGREQRLGMVLQMSVWHSTDMKWLDGYNNGPCTSADEDTDVLAKNHEGAFVEYSNIRFGELGTTSPVKKI